jgi:hypothetical protein
VVAVWEYDDAAHYEHVEAAVRDDPDSASAQRRRVSLGELFTSRVEVFMTSTLPDLPESRSLPRECPLGMEDQQH